MSARSRRWKAEARRRGRWAATRARIVEAQRPLAGLSAADLLAAVDPGFAVFCDGERAARKWCRDHPEPLPGGLGAAYRAKRGRSW